MIIELINERTRRLDDALYALSQTGPAPDAAALEHLVRRYPEHAAELTDYAIELALDALDDEADDDVVETASPDVTAAVLDAMSHFHNTLYALRSAQEHNVKVDRSATVANPLASLDRADLRALGPRLHANTVFVLKLRDRLIDAETIPRRFSELLAEQIDIPIELIAAHFRERPVIAAVTHFKADQKPEVGNKQSFQEAVRSSGLTSEQQTFLLSL
jgi:hypothetical protein